MPPLADDVRRRLQAFFEQHCTPVDTTTSAASGFGSSAEGVHVVDDPQPAQSVPRRVLTVSVDVMKLLNDCPELTDPLLLLDTMGSLELLTHEIHQSEIMKRTAALTTAPSAAAAGTPTTVSVRLTHVPRFSLNAQSRQTSQVHERVGTLVVISGTIVRLSAKRVVAASVRYRCGKCGSNSDVPSNPFHRSSAAKVRCKLPQCRGEPLQALSHVYQDYAEGRIQQGADVSGRLPRSVLVALDDELTSKCCVGHLVEVVGVLGQRWRNTHNGAAPLVELVVWASNICAVDPSKGASAAAAGSAAATSTSLAVPDGGALSHHHHHVASSGSKNHQPLPKGPSEQTAHMSAAEAAMARFRSQSLDHVRAALVRSTCPHLAGTFAPRLGLLLAAVGGAAVASDQLHTARATIHMLMVGDPATGKSQLLRFAAAIAPRSASTTGVTSTAAGLTVAAMKEFGEWVLEPGALVLSHGGTCCIDELLTVSKEDRTSLHEAMEQQTLSVAKAGLVTRLRTVCSIVAACNPPAKRSRRMISSTTCIGVGGPLLSRFDLIFLMWDVPNRKTDEAVATHVLQCSSAPPDAPLSEVLLAQYLATTRARYVTGGPLLDEACAALIGHYYETVRLRGPSANLEDAVPVTVRFLESLIRITQAHAKLMHRDTCVAEDAVMTIFVMERTAHALKFTLSGVSIPRNLPRDIAAAAEQSELHSGSKWLDDVFLSDDPACITLQRNVLRAIEQRYSDTPTSGAGPASCFLIPSSGSLLEEEDVDVQQQQRWCRRTGMPEKLTAEECHVLSLARVGGAGGSGSSPSRRKRSRAGEDPRTVARFGGGTGGTAASSVGPTEHRNPAAVIQLYSSSSNSSCGGSVEDLCSSSAVSMRCSPVVVSQGVSSSTNQTVLSVARYDPRAFGMPSRETTYGRPSPNSAATEQDNENPWASFDLDNDLPPFCVGSAPEASQPLHSTCRATEAGLPLRSRQPEVAAVRRGSGAPHIRSGGGIAPPRASVDEALAHFGWNS